MVKNLSANARNVKDSGSIPGSGKSPGGEHGNPLQHSCLENPVDRGAWWGQSIGLKEPDMTEGMEHAGMQKSIFSSNTSKNGFHSAP